MGRLFVLYSDFVKYFKTTGKNDHKVIGTFLPSSLIEIKCLSISIFFDFVKYFKITAYNNRKLNGIFIALFNRNAIFFSIFLIIKMILNCLV